MKNNKVSLISAISFIIIGIILMVDPKSIVKFISYFLGGILIAIGLYKCVNYYIQDKRLGIVNQNEMAFGVTAIILGIIFIFLASAIELLLRFIVGAWIIFAGLSKIVKTFYTTNRDAKFYSLLIVGIVLIAIGLYIVLVSNLALSIIGIFMVIYGITDFISYFVYNNNDYVVMDNDKNDIKEALVLEEHIEEEKDNKDKDKDTKKSKTNKTKSKK